MSDTCGLCGMMIMRPGHNYAIHPDAVCACPPVIRYDFANDIPAPIHPAPPAAKPGEPQHNKMSDEAFRERAEEENGQCISVAGDPDNADYRRGLAVGANYVADGDTNPASITFRNGTRVFIRDGALDVERNAPWPDVGVRPATPASQEDRERAPVVDREMLEKLLEAENGLGYAVGFAAAIRAAEEQIRVILAWAKDHEVTAKEAVQDCLDAILALSPSPAKGPR